MRSFTDLFIRHPVLAVVVNLAIVLMGWRALTSLPVQQYPNIQSSSVVITTVYYVFSRRRSSAPSRPSAVSITSNRRVVPASAP